MSCRYIFYCSQNRHFLSFLEKRVRLGASYYLTITLPQAKAEAKIEEYSTLFKIHRSASIRSRYKQSIPPVDLLVLQNTNLQQAGLVTLVFLFHLDNSFFIAVPDAVKFSEKGSTALNEIFGLKRKENFKSLFDKIQRLTINSQVEGKLVPVYTIQKMEIPKRIRGKYENYSSHQWVARLHPDFVKGKIEKINKLFEKARNRPKNLGSSSVESQKIREHEQFVLYSKINDELSILEKMYASFGIQKDVSFIKNKIFNKNKKAHKGFSFNFTHPTFKSSKPYSHSSLDDLLKIEPKSKGNRLKKDKLLNKI